MLKEIIKDCERFWVANNDEKVIRVGFNSLEGLFDECIMPDDERIVEGGYVGKLKGVKVYVGDFEYGYTVSRALEDTNQTNIVITSSTDSSVEVSEILEKLDLDNLT